MRHPAPLAAQSIGHGHAQKGNTSRTYYTWQAMKARCLRGAHKSFKDYGGRGIKVCERWMTFANFLADMGVRPDGAELDRINNDGNYEPGNCRWATRFEQQANRPSANLITFNGRTMTVRAWAREIGICNWGLQRRLAKWPLERAMTERPKVGRRSLLKSIDAFVKDWR